MRPVVSLVSATLKLISPILATRISSAFTSSFVNPAICVLPLTVSPPSNFTVAALISKPRPEGSVASVNCAFCVFLSVKIFAVITLEAASAEVEVSPFPRCPTIPAAFMVKSSWLLPKPTLPNVSILL